jgi:putative molybdopterin biosynthesis protein
LPSLLPALLDVGTDKGSTIVVTGSHDFTLDLLADTLHAAHPALTLVSAHVGSSAGLLALRRNQAHVAGAHLFDPESGEFNTAHIRRMLTPHGCRVVVMGFVTRIQGLMTPGGNPKQIHTVDDLLRADVGFVNRQPGAGTRLLLDYELDRRGLDARQIRGYGRTESSHARVAQAVADGHADCGLGIQAAAQAHHLDFVPLFEERFDLVIPVIHYQSALLAPLLALLQEPPAAFLDRVNALGGYGTARMGQVLAEV